MTDARAGKVAEKVLASPQPTARVGAVSLKGLASPQPTARVGSVSLKALGRPVIAGSLDATAVLGSVAFAGTYEDPAIGTDTSNGLEGFQLGGWVINEAPDPADPNPPAIWAPTRRDDLALYLPVPEIVDGRIVR